MDEILAFDQNSKLVISIVIMNNESLSIKKRILECAQKKILHYGYHKTTVEEIAEDAGIGKGTIYLHFKSKKDIFLQLILSISDEIIEEAREILQQTELDLKARFMKIIKYRFLKIYKNANANPHGHELVQAAGPMKDEILKATTQSRSQWQDIVKTVIEEGIQNGIFAVENPDKIAQHISSSFEILYPAIKMWDSADEISDYIETLVELFYKGMLK